MGPGALPTAGVLAPAQPRPRPVFALTPLADIMFQLLIFFMLTTSLAPYALLPLGPRGAEAAPQAEAPAPTSDAPTSDAPAMTVVWHLGRGELREGLTRFDIATLPEALARVAAEGGQEILVFVAAEAETQDLVTLLERARAPGAPGLRLMGR